MLPAPLLPASHTLTSSTQHVDTPSLHHRIAGPLPARWNAHTTRGAPLYLGVMRAARQPGAYSALLAFRPDAPGPQAVAVIGTNLASR